ncbi:MAG: preprotein translocase subunit SecY [Bacteroidia bacterium]|nr:preprotein translocase subunit SecY [Bacteroidia bacterium]
MRGLIETIKNIYKIEDLRIRIINTLSLLLIFRIGTFVVLPGVDPVELEKLTPEGGPGGLTGLLDMFAGGAFSRASIFALGIMPYISASIIIQLMSMALPYFQKLQKEGESGRKKISQITRYLTVAICGGQSMGYLINLKTQYPTAIISLTNPEVMSPMVFNLASMILLITGTIFVMWIGERITEKGLGNGISLLIMIGIIARLPFAFSAEFVSRFNEGGGMVPFLIEIAALVIVVIGVVLLVQGTRRIPVQFAKRIVGNKQYGGVRQFIPLKVNAAGVMPIIFAQAIMFLPATVAQFFPESDTWQGIGASFVDYQSIPYNITLALLVILFTYFYTAVSVNPNQMSEDMKKNGGFIPGVKPGKKTSEFIDSVMSRIILPGSIFLAIVAVFPAFAGTLGVNSQFAQFYGGTSLLIMVGVVLDTLQQIESHLLMRHYDGLMKTGRIKGRTAVGAAL